MPAAIQDAVYRIVHEALTNTQCHSDAERAEVYLRQANGELQLQVSPERFGLVGIEERARPLGGKAWIETTPGAGTHVTIVLPYEPRESAAQRAVVSHKA